MLHKTYNISLLSVFAAFLFHFSPVAGQELEIWQIQGSGSASAYVGQTVSTTANVVTVVGSGFFFLQSPANQADDDLSTSDGILVRSTQAGDRRVGDLIKVQGTVYETDGQTHIGQGTINFTFLQSNAPLPAIVQLDADFPSGLAGTVRELEAVEGMRVQLDGVATGPSDYESMLPVVARSERSFREPGIAYPGLPDLPIWDGNPEVFWMRPNALGQIDNRFIAAQTPVLAIGPLVQEGERYILYPENYELGDGPQPRAVRPAKADEITVASLNARRLESTDEHIDRKSFKLARYIVDMLRNPDLIAMQEVGSASVLSDLSFFIRQQSGGAEYTPFFLAGNDNINVAFLARKDVFQDVVITQLGKLDNLPGGGVVFDRPPLLFQARLQAGAQQELAVLNLHLRSLSGIEGSNATFVREKRHAQSIAVARMVQDLRETNLLVLGDCNAYTFSDGYVDVINQISGQNSLGAQYPVQDITDPPLHNLVEDLPEEEQYSFVFLGNAQTLDHALVNNMQDLYPVEMAYARGNADFPDAYAPNEQLVQRASDHDGLVVYLALTQPSAVENTLLNKQIQCYPNPLQSGDALYLKSPDGLYGRYILTGPEGRILQQGNLQSRQEVIIPEGVASGVYLLQLATDEGLMNRKIVVLSRD